MLGVYLSKKLAWKKIKSFFTETCNTSRHLDPDRNQRDAETCFPVSEEVFDVGQFLFLNSN